MANTRDTTGEQACLDALIAGTITEFEDDGVYETCLYMFEGNTTLTSVKLPNCKTLADSAFDGCTSLETVDLSGCEDVDGYAFRDCSSLEEVVFPVCRSLAGNYIFQGCTNLVSVILGHSGVVRIFSTTFPNRFRSGHAGTIYVPASKLAAYQASSDWSNYNLAAITE